MSDTANDIFKQVADYLAFQKSLGHPGLPVEMLLARRAADSEGESARPQARTGTTPSRAPSPPKPPADAAKPSGPRGITVNPIFSEAPMPAKRQTTEEARYPELDSAKTLGDIRAVLGDCQRCKLGETRQSIVFGETNPKARIMFIGEGPGADEDAQGRPFVGRAGKLLDRWIELGMGIKREDVYIANIVKCRPPKNRDPESDEVAACIPFLKAQIRAIKPEAIVLLGRVPMSRLLGEKAGITQVHGNWYDYEGIPTMPIFHPSYCLRPPLDEKRRLVWEDLKKLLAKLGMEIPKKKG